MKRYLLHFITQLTLLIGVGLNAQECQNNWLSTDGNKIVDINGEQVILTGVNWSGFETSSGVVDVLWERDWQSMLQQVKNLGFNCLRIPWSNDNLFTDTIVTSFISHDPDPYNNTPISNQEITRFETTALEVLDLIVNLSLIHI